MDKLRGKGLLIAGGVCGILWPILSVGYFAAYPVMAGGTMQPRLGGFGTWAMRLAELGQRPAVLALEWVYAATPLLLLPFLLALTRLLGLRRQRDLSLVGASLGLLGVSLMVLSYTFNATALHTLGQACAHAGSDAEGTAILATLDALLSWMRGLNQMSSLIYQGCVVLISLALIRSRTWRIWGWVGLVGAVLALPAKLSLGLKVPTNALWTGLAYGLWPVALGAGLLKQAGSPD